MNIRQSHPSLPRVLAALLLAAATLPAGAQQADRERAQLLQMQQQVQRLQSDNAAVQREKAELQGKVSAAEQEKKKAGGELAQVRQSASALKKDLAEARAKSDDLLKRVADLEGQVSQLKGQVAERDLAIRKAADDKRTNDSAAALLATRLKLNTERADQCEIKHDGLQKFSAAVIDRYEQDRLRLCEPITGLWRIRKEADIQQLRERLYGYRLDAAAPPVSAASAETTPVAEKSAR